MFKKFKLSIWNFFHRKENKKLEQLAKELNESTDNLNQAIKKDKTNASTGSE